MSTSVPLENTVALVPAVDVYENQDELLIRLDVPGASADTIDLRLEKNLLEIKAGRPGQNHETPGNFSRSFLVPGTIDGERITADVKEGVLEIRLPKREETKPRSIQVRSNN